MKIGLVLPDILISDVYNIINALNYKNINIYTSDIYNEGNIVGLSTVDKLINDVYLSKLSTVLILESKYFLKSEISLIKFACHISNCKLYFISKK